MKKNSAPHSLFLLIDLHLSINRFKTGTDKIFGNKTGSFFFGSLRTLNITTQYKNPQPKESENKHHSTQAINLFQI
jgi:hypothetical protein